jgi:hypothetical protein
MPYRHRERLIEPHWRRFRNHIAELTGLDRRRHEFT